MARQEDICSVPGCTKDVFNHKRGLCRACASSLYYWNRRKKEKRGAVQHRVNKLQFWAGRMDWMFQTAFVKSKGPIVEKPDGDQS